MLNAAVHHSKNCAMMSQRVNSAASHQREWAAYVRFAPKADK
jgi:hypothetical protein